MYKKILKSLPILLIGILCSTLIIAQKKDNYRQLPLSSSNYVKGTLAVKLNSNSTDRNSISNSSFSSYGITSVKPFVNQSQLNKIYSQRRKKMTIDIGNYFYLYYDKTLEIEDVIADLYATNKFEIVEPVYVNELDYTTNDPSTINQYYLGLINAYKAWDITQGDTNIVIAIVDSGIEYDHPDLKDNIYLNHSDPINGLDDDEDGYVDNYYGWDFTGETKDGFIEDNDPRPSLSNPAANHGTAVAGCASASTDNGVGIAGVGFKAKLMALKHSTTDGETSVFRAYEGIIYAANHGADIINCSWGGPDYSRIAQDIITYAVIDQNSLIIAAAGNSNTNKPHYPSGFDNVISVASTTDADRRSSFSNYGTTVDIAAPGSGIYTTDFGRAYVSIQGTSFSCPIVSGAAALVKATYPSMSAVQIGEILRATADESFYANNSTSVKDLLGKGRLDVFKAVTEQKPSIRFENGTIYKQNTSIVPVAGDVAVLFGDFKNHLWSSTEELIVKISTKSGFVTIKNDEFELGVVDQANRKSNRLSPFVVEIADNVPQNTAIDFKISYEDQKGDYVDYEYFSIIVNPSYFNIVENNISTSITGIGRFGYDDDERTRGLGFQYNGNQILYEMGLVLGTSEDKISSAVSSDSDFSSVDRIEVFRPGARADFEATGKINDDNAGGSKSDVEITYTAYAWSQEPFQNMILLEYNIKNNGSEMLNDFYAGLYADWDVSENGAKDFAKWNAESKLGYIYNWDNSDTTYGGIQVLEGNANHYAITNDDEAPGVAFGVYDGFTDAEKYTALSSGTTNDFAGSDTHTNSDVSHLVSAGPFDIASGSEIKVVLALHGADSFEELIASTKAADTAYNIVLQIPKPIATDADVCYGGDATLTASGASSFKWYREATGGLSFSTGSSISVENIFADSIFYVSNTDNNQFESARTKVTARTKANPNITVLGATSFCQGSSITLTVAEADSYLWTEIGGGTTFNTQSITVNSAGEYKVGVTDNTLACSNESEQTITTSILPSPSMSFTSELQSDMLTVDFTNTSTDAVSYSWDFGNGSTSEEQNPTHTYSTVETFQVELTAIGENGCEAKVSQSVIVTALENSTFSKKIAIYPNPSEGKFNLRMEGIASGEYKLEIYDLTGKLMMKKTIKSNGVSFQEDLNVSSFKAGQYLVQITGVDGVAVKRITKL